MNTIQTQFIMFALLTSLLVLNGYGQKTFDLKDPKNVNSMSFQLYSDLEPISGTATGISGEITFNPDKPEATRGRIIVSAADIKTTNKRMTQVLHGEDWIDVEKYPSVEYEITGISDVKRKGDTLYNLTTKGQFMLKGKSIKMEIPLQLSYQKGRLHIRNHEGNGDLIILRTNFSLDRKEFGIKPAMDNSTVAEQIDVVIGIVGAAPEKSNVQ